MVTMSELVLEQTSRGIDCRPRGSLCAGLKSVAGRSYSSRRRIPPSRGSGNQRHQRRAGCRCRRLRQEVRSKQTLGRASGTEKKMCKSSGTYTRHVCTPAKHNEVERNTPAVPLTNRPPPPHVQHASSALTPPISRKVYETEDFIGTPFTHQELS